MSTTFADPIVRGPGRRQQRAAELRAEFEAARHKPAAPVSETPAEPDPATRPVSEPQTGPVGSGAHVVQPGECMSSIARATGHFWERLWNDAGNADIRQARQDPHMLLPGDRVTVPELVKKQEPGQTEMRHRFRRRGEPGLLRLVIRDADEPRGNQPYVLKFEDREFSGHTDPLGQLEQPMPPGARGATLVVGEGHEREEYELNLGHLHPIDSISGVQARLDNLGYDVGAVDGAMTESTIAALEEFCVSQGLEPSPEGRIDETVRNKLREVHGF